MTIAQQFTAGGRKRNYSVTSPVGTVEMGLRRFDRPYGTELGARPALLPSDKSLGYYQTTLRVEILAVDAE